MTKSIMAAHPDEADISEPFYLAISHDFCGEKICTMEVFEPGPENSVKISEISLERWSLVGEYLINHRVAQVIENPDPRLDAPWHCEIKKTMDATKLGGFYENITSCATKNLLVAHSILCESLGTDVLAQNNKYLASADLFEHFRQIPNSPDYEIRGLDLTVSIERQLGKISNFIEEDTIRLSEQCKELEEVFSVTGSVGDIEKFLAKVSSEMGGSGAAITIESGDTVSFFSSAETPEDHTICFDTDMGKFSVQTPIDFEASLVVQNLTSARDSKDFDIT